MTRLFMTRLLMTRLLWILNYHFRHILNLYTFWTVAGVKTKRSKTMRNRPKELDQFLQSRYDLPSPPKPQCIAKPAASTAADCDDPAALTAADTSSVQSGVTEHEVDRHEHFCSGNSSVKGLKCNTCTVRPFLFDNVVYGFFRGKFGPGGREKIK